VDTAPLQAAVATDSVSVLDAPVLPEPDPAEEARAALERPPGFICSLLLDE
jgi:hypothetical protein